VSAPWFNVDFQDRKAGGLPDFKKTVSGLNPEQLAVYAVKNIEDCYLREIGRPPTNSELAAVWRRAIVKHSAPYPFKRCPESEVL
jgi:hypothetical protein